ncbi:MAG: hypothetical protein E6Q88_05995 [Lysobacteraceae bacterium]|nr:MAG: hypothetical protein E6Q88_05995 [Xanthomonadaceae bacterium]
MGLFYIQEAQCVFEARAAMEAHFDELFANNVELFSYFLLLTDAIRQKVEIKKPIAAKINKKTVALAS